MENQNQNQNQAQTMNFQTEVKQLLQLMIHSLYSNKEIFLRELISNASDACDKLRFEALNNPDKNLYENDSELKIQISYDKDAKTLTISDNGIGLSYDDAIANLGTIAKSGTKEFFSSLTGDQAKDAHLIGQFGVGFYSAFIVAEKVQVNSRKAGLPENEAICWESKGDGEFNIQKINKKSRGTDVILTLKSDGENLNDIANHFLNAWEIKNIIQKYSDHFTLPIQMEKEEWDDDKKQNIKKIGEFETINQASALWTRNKNEISQEQYNEFYKHVAHDFENPLCWTHAKVEGKQEYTELLYVPSKAPFDLWDRNSRHGVKLYVRRVFIMDDAEKLMPTYLRFIRGIVDSADLPLNISREILQESKDIDNLRKGCTNKVLSMLENLQKNQPEKYAEFWKNFGSVLKEGIGEDFANQAKIAGLLRFATSENYKNTNSEDQTITLKDYIANMKEGQDKIYYVTADSFKAAYNSPHLEIFKKKGIDVLLLSERVDEWVVGYLHEFEGKKLQSVAKGGLDLGSLENEEEKQQTAKAADDNKDLTEKIKAVLADKVKEVRITHRLTDSPSCLVSEDNEMSGNMARILQAAGQKIPYGLGGYKPILEINPTHPTVLLAKTHSNDDKEFSDWANLLFEEASLAEGGTLEDPAGFVKRINKLVGELAAK